MGIDDDVVEGLRHRLILLQRCPVGECPVMPDASPAGQSEAILGHPKVVPYRAIHARTIGASAQRTGASSAGRSPTIRVTTAERDVTVVAGSGGIRQCLRGERHVSISFSRPAQSRGDFAADECGDRRHDESNDHD